jgi:hypothetical protein
MASIARIRGDGMVEWNAQGMPTAYQLQIIDTTSPTFIARFLALHGRDAWVGYPQGWDVDAQVLALHPYRYYRLFDNAATDAGIGRFAVTLHWPGGTELYANVYTRSDFLDQTGHTGGIHPCGSVAINKALFDALEASQ